MVEVIGTQFVHPTLDVEYTFAIHGHRPPLTLSFTVDGLNMDLEVRRGQVRLKLYYDGGDVIAEDVVLEPPPSLFGWWRMCARNTIYSLKIEQTGGAAMKATVYEQGNGFPPVGAVVSIFTPRGDVEPYEVVRYLSNILTDNTGKGGPNYAHVLLAPTDKDDEPFDVLVLLEEP